MTGFVLDHLLLGARDLEQGSFFAEQCFGVSPVAGGVHPGQGTCNSLLGLGKDKYIEVIAPDPQQSPDLAINRFLGKLKTPALMWWAVRCMELTAVEASLRRLKLNGVNLQPVSRRTPDGRVLTGLLLMVDEPALGTALPFFIERPDADLHPARNLPSAGELKSLQIFHPAAGRLQSILGEEFEIFKADRAKLCIVINQGNNTVSLSTPKLFPPGIGSIVRA